MIVTANAGIIEEVISEYHEAAGLVERFNDPWSAEASRTLRFMIRLLEEAKSSAV